MFFFVLVGAVKSSSSPTAPQPAQAGDDPSPATTGCGGTIPPSNFFIPMLGQSVLKVMFILLFLVLLVLHALQSPNLFVKIEATVYAYIFMFLLLPLVEELKPCMPP